MIDSFCWSIQLFGIFDPLLVQDVLLLLLILCVTMITSLNFLYFTMSIRKNE